MNRLLNKIIHGDCLDVMKKLPNNCIDLILTDIPYSEVNQNYGSLRVLGSE